MDVEVMMRANNVSEAFIQQRLKMFRRPLYLSSRSETNSVRLLGSDHPAGCV
jgi:hypothetical protein